MACILLFAGVPPIGQGMRNRRACIYKISVVLQIESAASGCVEHVKVKLAVNFL
jgi:hypothetical protein